MKKYIYTAILLCSGIFFSCNEDVDGKMDGIDDFTKPKEVGHYKHTIVDADFATIATALKAEGTDEAKALADKLTKEKQFSAELNPATLIPYLLPSVLKSPDVGASFDVTYNYNHGRTAALSTMSEDAYVLTSADYAKAWKNPSVDAYTPAQSPAANLPNVLKEQLTGKAEGTYANVNYFYSEEEPYVADVRGEDYILEDFSAYTVKYENITKNGWFTTDLKGSKAWQANVFSDNWYAQMSSNNSKEENDVWMVSPQIDLGKATNPRFTFDIKSAYYNADCLSIWVSSDFDGNSANIDPAKWKNISNEFNIPKDLKWPNDFASAGSADLKDYKGKKIYVALRYVGDGTDNSKTTSYQIDNIAVHENIPGIAVKEKSLVHDLYVLKANVWTKVTDKNIIVLQPQDFADMGVGAYLSKAKAPEYLDNYLKQKYPFAEVGAVKTIVYRTSADGTKCYADELSLVSDNGVKTWTTNAFIETKEDQFIFAASKKWIFDPTFVVKFAKPDYQVLVEYVKVNQAIDNPNLIDRDNTELFYGFSAYYGNVNYRDVGYRNKDVAFAALGDDAKAKRDLMNRRTEEAVGIYLTLQYPNATEMTNGVQQEAKITVYIYRDPEYTLDMDWTYHLKCVGDKKWEFIERVSETGIVEKAGEY